jgi:hypothetical protein
VTRAESGRWATRLSVVAAGATAYVLTVRAKESPAGIQAESERRASRARV